MEESNRKRRRTGTGWALTTAALTPWAPPRRAKRSAWEVDCLINADEDRSIAGSLLERMAADVGRQGAERVFLRVAADCSLVGIARAAGLFCYPRPAASPP